MKIWGLEWSTLVISTSGTNKCCRLGANSIISPSQDVFLICAIHIDVLPFLALCIMRHYARCCCCGAFFLCASFSNNEVPQTLKRKMPPPCSLNHIGILVTLYIMTVITRQRASVWICQMINTFQVCVCYLWRGIVYLRSLSRSDPQRCSNNVTSIPTGVL